MAAAIGFLGGASTAALVTGLLLTAPAHAAQTVTYGAAGQSGFVVPQGVSTISAVVVSGGGGGGAGMPGSWGGYAGGGGGGSAVETCTFSVTGGQSLTIVIPPTAPGGKELLTAQDGSTGGTATITGPLGVVASAAPGGGGQGYRFQSGGAAGGSGGATGVCTGTGSTAPGSAGDTGYHGNLPRGGHAGAGVPANCPASAGIGGYSGPDSDGGDGSTGCITLTY